MKNGFLNRLVDEVVFFVYAVFVTYPYMLLMAFRPQGVSGYVRRYMGEDEAETVGPRLIVLSPIWFFLISSTFVRLFLLKWFNPDCTIVWERAAVWSEVEWVVKLIELLLIVGLNAALIWLFEWAASDREADVMRFRVHFLRQAYLWGLFYIVYRLALSVNSALFSAVDTSLLTYFSLALMLVLQATNYLPEGREVEWRIPRWGIVLGVLAICAFSIYLQIAAKIVDTNEVINLLLWRGKTAPCLQ